jgi:[ribosomal protein S18]-alanine N-acetyltransferase
MIRKYTQKDETAVLQLIKQHTPQYFAPAELEDFKNYLRNKTEDYFVYIDKAQIIAAGGINYFPAAQLARISWDMVATHAQGKGIGAALVQFRINYLNQSADIETIVVRTAQDVYQFYQKMGFKLIRVEKDYWAEGFDLYEMHLKNKIT